MEGQRERAASPKPCCAVGTGRSVIVRYISDMEFAERVDIEASEGGKRNQG